MYTDSLSYTLTQTFHLCSNLQNHSGIKWCAQEVFGDVECFPQELAVLAEGDGALVQVYVAADAVVLAKGLRERERAKVILTVSCPLSSPPRSHQTDSHKTSCPFLRTQTPTCPCLEKTTPPSAMPKCFYQWARNPRSGAQSDTPPTTTTRIPSSSVALSVDQPTLHRPSSVTVVS